MKRMYTARELERLTGVSALTIQTWERRYGVPLSITQEETGVRLYPEQSVEFVKWAKAQLVNGLTIGQAILLVQAEVRRLPGDPVKDK